MSTYPASLPPMRAGHRRSVELKGGFPPGLLRCCAGQPLVQIGKHVGRHGVEESVESYAVQEAPPLLTPRADESIHRELGDIIALEPVRCRFQSFNPRQPLLRARLFAALRVS